MSDNEMPGSPPGYPEFPQNVVVFGPGGNCTLELCPLEASVYQYRPSMPANTIFLAIYALLGLVHLYLGWRWKSWWFAIPMVVGCTMQIAGYAGRIIMYNNPFSFAGFMLQIACIATAPVFYTASIYVTISKTVEYFSVAVSRFRPKMFYWFFIPADVVCLILQGAGGVLSTISQGVSQKGVDVAMAGLVLQVVVIAGFIATYIDYMVRYVRTAGTPPLTHREKMFIGFLFTAIFLILGRCLYRCYELSEGYTDSSVISDEVLFIVLEGVVIVLAVICLCIGHPGFIFQGRSPSMEKDGMQSDSALQSTDDYQMQKTSRV